MLFRHTGEISGKLSRQMEKWSSACQEGKMENVCQLCQFERVGGRGIWIYLFLICVSVCERERVGEGWVHLDHPVKARWPTCRVLWGLLKWGRVGGKKPRCHICHFRGPPGSWTRLFTQITTSSMRGYSEHTVCERGITRNVDFWCYLCEFMCVRLREQFQMVAHGGLACDRQNIHFQR